MQSMALWSLFYVRRCSDGLRASKNESKIVFSLSKKLVYARIQPQCFRFAS